MDFLGRVEAAIIRMAARMHAPVEPIEAFDWCVARIPGTRNSYRHLQGFLAEDATDPNGLLWTHWNWIRSPTADHENLDSLWNRAFANQSPAGHLHLLTPDTLLDAFVYDELTALHAAYRSALALRDSAKLAQCRRIVDYHVQNTQPDHTTAEPWALAAFAALDDTHTFAEQQLHDAITAATTRESPVILALLADAVLAMRDARAWTR